jgi:hypothetical protein
MTRFKPFAAVLCLVLLLLSALPSLTAAPADLIHDSQGHTWLPTGENLVLAFNSLQPNTELWIPAGNFTITDTNLCITKDGIKIHGSGPSPLIYFSNGGRLITGRYADANTDNIRYQYGVNNLLLENFMIRGYGCIEVVLGDITRLRGIQANDIYAAPTPRPAALRFVLPLNDSYCSVLQVINCHTNHTFNHGFQINGINPGGTNTLNNVLFYHCSASYAGWQYPGRPTDWNWSTGFDLGEGYDNCHLIEPRTIVLSCTADHNWESGFHIESSVQKTLTLIRCEADYNGQKRIYYPSSPQYFASGFIAENGIRLAFCTANNNTNRGVMWRNSPVIIAMKGTGNWNGLY